MSQRGKFDQRGESALRADSLGSLRTVMGTWRTRHRRVRCGLRCKPQRPISVRKLQAGGPLRSPLGSLHTVMGAWRTRHRRVRCGLRCKTQQPMLCANNITCAVCTLRDHARFAQQIASCPKGTSDGRERMGKLSADREAVRPKAANKIKCAVCALRDYARFAKQIATCPKDTSDGRIKCANCQRSPQASAPSAVCAANRNVSEGHARSAIINVQTDTRSAGARGVRKLQAGGPLRSPLGSLHITRPRRGLRSKSQRVRRTRQTGHNKCAN